MAATKLIEEARALFREGITMTLSRWSCLQLAVKNEWGGPGSLGIPESLASEILSWFTETSQALIIGDLEDILEGALFDDLKTVIEDHSSVTEVAEKLMTMHAECLEGNYQSVLNLRAETVKTDSQKAVNDDVDDGSSNVPKPQPKSSSHSNSGLAGAVADGSLKVSQQKSTGSMLKFFMGKGAVGADADGWVTVWDRRGADAGDRDGPLKVCTRKNTKK